MKKQTGIWIDTSKAVIVSLEDGKDHLTQIESDIENTVNYEKEGSKGYFSGGHHVNSESKFDERKKHLIDNFLTDVIQQVKDSDEVYVFGPAEAKNKLKQQFQTKFSTEATKLKSIENADHMTEKQIVAKVKQFYHIGNFGPQRNFGPLGRLK